MLEIVFIFVAVVVPVAAFGFLIISLLASVTYRRL